MATPLSLAASIVLWASAFVGIRAALTEYTPGHLALLRFVVGAGALLAALPFRRRRLAWPGRAAAGSVLLTALFIAAYNLLLNWGEQTVTAASASFIVNTVPLFTALLAVAFLRERVSFAGWAGMLVSFVGVAIIASGEGGRLSGSPGSLAILGAAFSQATYFALQKKLLREHGAYEVTLVTLALSAVFLLPLARGLPEAVAAASTEATVAAIYLGIFPSAVAFFTWSYALKRMAASRASAFLYSVPLVTIGIGWIWLGELPGAVSLAGGAVTLVGMLVSGRGMARK